MAKVFQDQIPPAGGRKYQISANSDGSSNITDITQYQQDGTPLTAEFLNGLQDGTYPVGKADKLATARMIGSASFDGSADITLAQMGAAINPVYSTEEYFTGSYWIDGRPIYRKVFTFELPEIPSGNTSARFNLSTDIDPGAIIDLTARFNQNEKTNYGIPMGADFVNPEFSTFVFWSSSVPKRLIIDYGLGVSKQPAMAIIKYTKTTDTKEG